MPNQLFLFPSGPTPEGPPDAHERELALDITRSILVEAPAGSGKTGLLIQRFLKLLASESVLDPRQVLAITFTRKATAELRDRVLKQLANASGAPSQTASPFEVGSYELARAVLLRDTRLNWNLLDNPNRLNIRTIDALCQEIAGALPILSGSGGAQSPTEDPAPLHNEAARRTLMLLGGEDEALTSALETLLLHRDGNLANCESLIAYMLARREQWGELIPLAQPLLTEQYLDQTVLPRLDRALDVAICHTLTHVADSVSQPLLTRLCELAADMGELEGYKGNPSPLAVCAGNSQQPEERSADLEHWRALVDLLLTADGKFRAPRGLHKGALKFLIQPHHKGALAEIIDAIRDDESIRRTLCAIRTLPPAQYPRDQWPVTKSLFRVLARALAELQLVFAERAQCDFTEVSLLARHALRHDSALDDLAASSGARLQHLLVDEMQDTSTLQYEFLQLLTRRWDGHSQTVFLVGDPKQSIYLFRQARVERFLATLRTRRLGDIPLTVLRLTANFRSQPQLVESFNEDFTAIFAARQDQTDEIPYTPAHPTRTGAGRRIWHAQPIPSDGDALATAQNQARQIRQTIETWSAKPLPPDRTDPWRIAVLVRNRAHLTHIVSALKQSPAIPYRAVEIDPLAERPEILDLLALTRALLHPADRTAWLALLRSPVCGLALADLHRLANADPEATIFHLLEIRGADLSCATNSSPVADANLSPDGIARLQTFFPIVRDILQLRGSLPLSAWVARAWRAFNLPAHLPADALANAESLFHLLDQLEQPGPAIDLAHLAEKVAKLYAAPSTAPDAVDLMTLHKAKGLEWDVVLVPELHRVARNNETALLSWLETSPDDLMDDEIAAGILAPISGKGRATTQLTAWMRSVENAREAAERKRLFYVASTRAREELHLFAAPQRSKSGNLNPPAGSLLQAAWPAAQPHFLAPIIAFPTTQPNIIRTIAANAPTQIQRIPHIPGAPPQTASSFEVGSYTSRSRPEGSFAARAFGNTLHGFLELLATRIVAGETPTALNSELPQWQPRIAAVLRASGLPPSEITRLTAEVLRGLTRTLTHPEGQWLLAPHPQASSESSLATADGQIRLDRTFLAGPTPLSTGTSHLWIVDYKTTTHPWATSSSQVANANARGSLEAFLAEERERHAPQLESYARQLAPQTPHPSETSSSQLANANQPIRLALYYPMLPHLLWWEAPTS